MDRKVRRSELCSVIWPHLSLEGARQSLRTALTDLRSKLGDDTIEADRDSVALKRGAFEVDASRFMRSRNPEHCPHRLLPEWEEEWVRDIAADFDRVFENSVLNLLPSLESGEARRLGELCLARDPGNLAIRGKLRELGLVPIQRVRGAAATSFVGRVSELEDLERLLDSNRLVTITGLGGSGKSRLAHELLTRYERAWFVYLSDCQDASQLAETIRAQIGLPGSVNTSPIDQIVIAVGDSEGVLLLDNFEHLLTEGDLVETLIERCPGLRIVVTSKVPLQTSSETCYPLGPLRTGASGPHPSEGADLFLARAASIVPGFRADSETLSLIEAICERVDGFPIAIELAAAKLRVFSIAEILELSQEGSEFLERDFGRQSHRSLRSAMDWSFDCLTEPQQGVLLDLAVFRGGFTLSAAREILETQAAWKELDALVAASWVQRTIDAGGIRFRLLESVRQFALELSPPGRIRRNRAAHAEQYLSLARLSLERAFTPEEEEIHREVGREAANLEAAFHWWLEADPLKAVETVGSLGWYSVVRGECELGEARLGRALAKIPDGDGAPFGYAHHAMANFLIFRGRFAEAEPWLLKSVQIASRTGERLTEAVSTQQLAWIYGEAGQFDKAETLIVRALELVKDHPNLNWIGTMLTIRVVLSNRRADWDLSLSVGQEALGYCRAGGYRWGLASLLNEMAHASRRRGDLEASLDYELESIEIKRSIDTPRSLVISLIGLAETQLALGQKRSAVNSLAEACRLLRSLTDWHSLPDVYWVGSLIAESVGEGRLAGACRSLATSGQSETDLKRETLMQLSAL